MCSVSAIVTPSFDGRDTESARTDDTLDRSATVGRERRDFPQTDAVLVGDQPATHDGPHPVPQPSPAAPRCLHDFSRAQILGLATAGRKRSSNCAAPRVEHTGVDERGRGRIRRHDVRASPIGNRAATMDLDGAIRLWQVHPLREILVSRPVRAAPSVRMPSRSVPMQLAWPSPSAEACESTHSTSTT